MSRLMRDGTAEPVSRDQSLRRDRGQGKNHFPCSADHEQDCHPVDPYSCCMSDHTYIHTYMGFANTLDYLVRSQATIGERKNCSHCFYLGGVRFMHPGSNYIKYSIMRNYVL